MHRLVLQETDFLMLILEPEKLSVSVGFTGPMWMPWPDSSTVTAWEAQKDSVTHERVTRHPVTDHIAQWQRTCLEYTRPWVPSASMDSLSPRLCVCDGGGL